MEEVLRIRDDDRINNFILLVKQGRPRVYFIVNKDKVSNTKTYNKDKSLSYIEVENKRLIDIIYKSYARFPRLYLFERNNNKISDNTLLNYLRAITKEPKLNIDMMRSVYITDFYEKHKSYQDREKLALQMRHSFVTAARNYFKVSEDENKPKDEQIEELKNKLVEMEIEKNKLREKANKCEPDVKLFQKRRYDILYHITNHGTIPKAETLNKYNIKFDEQSNKYV